MLDSQNELGPADGAIRPLARFVTGHALTCLVFRPTPGTAYAQARPPDPAEVVAVLIEAARTLPAATVFHLGCMRPAGAYRRRLDILAWLAGFRSIVMPDRELVAALDAAGVTRRETPECCSL